VYLICPSPVSFQLTTLLNIAEMVVAENVFYVMGAPVSQQN